MSLQRHAEKTAARRADTAPAVPPPARSGGLGEGGRRLVALVLRPLFRNAASAPPRLRLAQPPGRGQPSFQRRAVTCSSAVVFSFRRELGLPEAGIAERGQHRVGMRTAEANCWELLTRVLLTSEASSDARGHAVPGQDMNGSWARSKCRRPAHSRRLMARRQFRRAAGGAGWTPSIRIDREEGMPSSFSMAEARGRDRTRKRTRRRSDRRPPASSKVQRD